MQLLPNRQNLLAPYHGHDPDILPFTVEKTLDSPGPEPAGIIDLDVVRLPETAGRNPAAAGHCRHLWIEADLDRLVDELDQRLDQLNDRIAHAVSPPVAEFRQSAR